MISKVRPDCGGRSGMLEGNRSVSPAGTVKNSTALARENNEMKQLPELLRFGPSVDLIPLIGSEDPVPLGFGIGLREVSGRLP